MKWINLSEREPEYKDLPFLTYKDKQWELWEDTDWFQELSEKERLSYIIWLPLKFKEIIYLCESCKWEGIPDFNEDEEPICPVCGEADIIGEKP